jgi:3-dehydroquinate synthase
MRKDKKREGDAIQFVLLEKIGKAIIRNIPLKHLEKVINELKE